MAGVRLSAMVGKEERFAISDETGRYFLKLPSGNYTVQMEAEGFVPQTFQKKVKIGVKGRLSVMMERVVAPVVALTRQEMPAIVPTPPVNLADIVEGVVQNGVH